MGMTKEKWPHVTAETIQSYLDDPSILDDQLEWDDYIDCFYKYYDWYLANQRSKQ